MTIQKYLQGYPANIIDQVTKLQQEQRLGEVLLKRYPDAHQVRSDAALYDYAMAMKNQSMRNAPPLARVSFDNKIKVIQHALGQHHFISRVQGGKLKAVNEIKVASLFRTVPEAFLRMILAHELAHFKEKEHNKAFYQLCRHIEPNYHQYELDLRLYLIQLDSLGALYH